MTIDKSVRLLQKKRVVISFSMQRFGQDYRLNHAVRDLKESWDSILFISGIFSGALSWLFLQFDCTIPFNRLVKQAWQRVYLDPRFDLSGRDAMRTLIILTREADYKIEPEQT